MLNKFGILISMSALLFAFSGCSDDDDDPQPTPAEYTAEISVSGVDEAGHASAFTVTADGQTLSFADADFSGGTLSGEISELQGDVEVTLTVDNDAVAEGTYAIDAPSKTVNEDSNTAPFAVTFTPDDGGTTPTGESLIPNYNWADGLEGWLILHGGTADDFPTYESDNGMQVYYEGGGLKEIFSPYVETEAGKMYTLAVTCDVLGEVGGDGTNVKIRFYSEELDDEGNYTFISEVNYFLEQTEGFETLEFTIDAETPYAAVAPEGAAYLNVTFAHWHDTPEVYLEEVLVNEYTGDNGGGGGGTTSLVPNYNFADDMDMWTPREGTDARWYFIDSPNGNGRTLEYEGGDGREILEFTSSPITDVEVGAEYTISIVANVVEGFNGGANFKLRAWDAEEGFLGEEWMNFPNEPTDGFETFTNTMTVPENTAYLDVLMAMFDGDGNTGVIQVDEVIVEKVE